MISPPNDSEVYERVRDVLTAYTDRRHWALALSGGRDSMVLLHILSRICTPDKLTALHVHHGISSNADHWERHCRRQCALLGVPYRCLRPPSLAGVKSNLEHEARRLRYQALYRALPSNSVLMTAHHLLDQVETYLYRQLRGVGVYGSGAMQVASEGVGGAYLVRPMLDAPLHTIENYARAHRLRWKEDPLNQDQSFQRNWIRHRLHPLLVRRVPALDRVIHHNAKLQQKARALCEDLADMDLVRLTAPPDDSLAWLCPSPPRWYGSKPKAGCDTTVGASAAPALTRWSLPALRALPDYRLENLLHCFIRTHKRQSPAHGMIASLLQWLRARRREYSANTIMGLNFRHWRSQVWIDTFTRKELAGRPQAIALTRLDDPDPSDVNLPVGKLGLRVRQGLSTVKGSVYLRSKRAGDRILWRGDNRSLAKVLQQHTIPPWLRDRVPLIVAPERIVAVRMGSDWTWLRN